MRRILVFAAYYYPHIGGYEKNIHELNKRLAQKGFEIDVVTCNTDKASTNEELDGIRIHRLPTWNIPGGTYPIPKPTPATFKILRHLFKENADLVNTQTRFFLTSFLGLVFAKIKRVPLVHTERGTRHSVTQNKLVEAIGKAYDHTIGSLIVKSASTNIGVSQAACGFAKHLGAKNTFVIPNGIDTNIFRKVETSLRKQLGLDCDTVITFVGRIIYAKGTHDLIAAFAKVKEQTPAKLKLLIVGDGPYRKELERLAQKSGCGGDVLFLGQKNQKEVAEILSISDIFVNPSYSEGLPTSVMEAASVGLPTIATDVGGTREVINNGNTGILIEPHQPQQIVERITSLIRDSKTASKLGMAARNLISQKFDWAEVTEQWISCVTSGLEAKPDSKKTRPKQGKIRDVYGE